MKYLKIVLSILLISCFCALSVAGVNFFTAPKIEQNKTEQRLKSYKEIFPELDAATSEILTKGKDGVTFKSSFVTEKVIARDKDSKDLGFCVATSGKNTYGPISLTVGISAEGKLVKVVITENGQTGGKNVEVNNWVDSSFNEGMSQTDVDALAPQSGATFGSNLVKNLVNAAFAEAGIMSALQKELVGYFGETVDMSTTVEDTNFMYPKLIKIGYDVKNANGETLGYLYKLTNDNIVVLNANKETLEANTAVSKEVELIKTEINNEFNALVAAKYLYNDNVTVNALTLTETEAKIAEAKYEVLLNGNKIATMVVTNGTTQVPDLNDPSKMSEVSIKLAVVINNLEKLEDIFILENTQTAGRDKMIQSFIAGSFDTGMTGLETQAVETISKATKGTKLVKELVANAFEVVTGVKPEKPVVGYDSYYLDAFTGVDLANKKVLEIKDNDAIFEAVELADKDNNVLGRAFVFKTIEPQFQGEVELFVAIDKTAKLAKVVIINSGHTNGVDMNNLQTQFKPGMGQADIDSIGNVASGTITSKFIKDLVKSAFKYIDGAYNDLYLQAFPNMDLGKSVEIKKFKDSHITSGLEAKDSKGETLGKIYMIKLTNTHSWHLFMVALDNDGKVVKVIDVETDHGQMGADKLDVLKGATIDTLDDVVIAQGTYSVEIVKLAVRTAMVEFGKAHATNEIELIMKDFFPKAVWKLSKDGQTTGFKNSEMLYKYTVKGNESNKESLEGYLYKVAVKADTYQFTLVIALDANNNYVGAKIVEYKNTVTTLVPSAFGDNVLAKTQKYLNNIKVGTPLSQLVNLPSEAGNAFVINIMSYAFNVIRHENDGIKLTYDTDRVFDITDIYAGLFDGTNLFESELLLETGNSDLLQVFTAKDYKGNVLGKAYLVFVNNVYSHNYVLVVIGNDGKLVKFMDVQNDHAELEKTLGYFDGKTTLEEILAVAPTTGGSYSIDIIRLAAEVAFTYHRNGNASAIDYEKATTTLFPFMVEARSYQVVTTPEQKTVVPYGYIVYGVENYQKNKFLGISLVVKVNNEEVVLGFDKQGNLMATKFVLLAKESKLQAAFASITKDIKSDADIDALANTGLVGAELDNFKVALKVALSVAKNNIPLTTYDPLIYKAWANYSPVKSEAIKSFSQSEINSGVKVKDAQGTELGVAYVITLNNLWSEGNNVVLICLNKNGTYHDLYDIEWHHGSLEGVDDEHGPANKKSFKDGMTFEDLDKLLSTVVGGTMTKEMTILAIKIAMNEYTKLAPEVSADVRYESEAKRIFTGMITKHSTKLNNFKNKDIKWGIFAKGPAGYQNMATDPLGNIYVVETTYGTLTLKIMIAIDTKGNVFKSNVLSFDYSSYGYLGDNTIEYANSFLSQFVGMNITQVVETGLANYENLLIDKCAYDALLAALNEFAGTTYVDNSGSIYKPLLNGAFDSMVDMEASTKLEVKDTKYVLEAYNVVDIKGVTLGKVVFVNASNTYAEAYYRVSIDAEGKLVLVTEISNNHGSNKDTCKEFSVKPLTYDELNAKKFTAHSFTFEQVKLAAKIAMVEANGLTVVDTMYENATKQLLPYAVWQRSTELKNPEFTFGMHVKGTVRFDKDDQFLGYVFAFEVNGLEIMVSFDKDNNLFPIDYWTNGNLYPNRVIVLKNNTKHTNEEVIKFFSQYEANIKDASKLAANNTGLDAELVKAINDKLSYLIQYISFGPEAVLACQPFNGFDCYKTERVTPKQTEVSQVLVFKDSKGTVLGYAVTVTLNNLWSEGNNVFVVLLDNNKKYKDLFDVEWHHGAMGLAGQFGPATKDEFKPGWGLKEINDFLAVTTEHTMSKEMCGLGIKIAINEVESTFDNDTKYESACKLVFTGAIMRHSTKLTVKDSAIKWAYEIKGPAGFHNVKTEKLGNAYVVELNGKLVLVGIDNNNKVQAVYDFETNGLVKELAGLDKAGVEASTNALKDLVLKAFVELGGNN